VCLKSTNKKISGATGEGIHLQYWATGGGRGPPTSTFAATGKIMDIKVENKWGFKENNNGDSRRIIMDEKLNKINSLRKQINIRLEQELYEFLVMYSKGNYKTVTAVVREMIATLYKEHKQALIRSEDGTVIVKRKVRL